MWINTPALLSDYCKLDKYPTLAPWLLLIGWLPLPCFLITAKWRKPLPCSLITGKWLNTPLLLSDYYQVVEYPSLALWLLPSYWIPLPCSLITNNWLNTPPLHPDYCQVTKYPYLGPWLLRASCKVDEYPSLTLWLRAGCQKVKWPPSEFNGYIFHMYNTIAGLEYLLSKRKSF